VRIIYGINPVKEALRAGSGINKLVVSRRTDERAIKDITNDAFRLNIIIERADKSRLDELAPDGKHQGVVLVMSEGFNYVELDDMLSAWRNTGERALILVLDSIEDPQNLGAMIRSAVAAGAHGVIVPKDRAAGVTPAVVKASAGATAHVSIARVTNISSAIEALKKENIWVIGLAGDSDIELYDASLDIDVAFVVGAEGRGLRPLVRKNCDYAVRIPMAGTIGSLNAAQAMTIALFEARRKRRG
jgi:23S rRNA (guanosine2251-2'-O)-methyltransferase